MSRGHVVVHCPFCGVADKGMHMSVSIDGKGWRCFRNKDQHKGKNPARLVQALIGCSMTRAREIVGQSVYIPDDFMKRIRGTLAPDAAPQKRKRLLIPDEFKSFKDVPSARPFVNYLRNRSFGDATIFSLTERYDIHYVTRGPYSGRIVFAVWFEDCLVSWTGRTISKNTELRYKTLSDDAERAASEGLPPAHGPISDYLLWYDDLRDADADTLILCEGPFDALKVNVLGRKHGIRATCFFTSSPSDGQIELLHTICPQFKRRVLLLDRGTLATGLRVSRSLSTLGVVPLQLPQAIKDPGEFTPNTFRKIVLDDPRVVP